MRVCVFAPVCVLGMSHRCAQARQEQLRTRVESNSEKKGQILEEESFARPVELATPCVVGGISAFQLCSAKVRAMTLC